MELTVSLETICRIVIRARENEAQVPAVDPDDSSSAIDDNAMEVLEDENNVSIEEELNAIIEDLADDQALEVIALALVGRGSFDASEWEDALEAAAEEITPSRTATDVLMEFSMLAAYLEAGLAAFDKSCGTIGAVS